MPSFLNIRPISYTFSNPPTCHPQTDFIQDINLSLNQFRTYIGRKHTIQLSHCWTSNYVCKKVYISENNPIGQADS